MNRRHDITPGSVGGGGRRLVAAAAALAVAGAGLAAGTVAASAAPASTGSGSCVPVNPMGGATPTGSKDGYTIFVKNDAILANSELEGTLAVGGKATFGDTRGNQNPQYPIMHSSGAGNADYNVPTISEQPNRVLIQEFSSIGKVVQVQARGAEGDNAKAGAKLGDEGSPAGYTFGKQFGGDGTTFYPADGDNQSPQLESQVQPWSGLAAAESDWAIDGDVLSLFPTDDGAEALESFADWQPVEAPTGSDQTIQLSENGPSKLALSDFKNSAKYKLEGYSQDSFLVITVDPSDIVDGKVALPSYSVAGNEVPSNEGISYVLFDFSKVNGEVKVVPAGDRVRGSIYAPNAHIVFPAISEGGNQFEGQIIAGSFTALQGAEEMHTNLFKGALPCSGEPVVETGGFDLSKSLKGVSAKDFPEGTVFTVTASWSVEGKESTAEYKLPVDGSTVEGARELPVGTKVTFGEVEAPKIEGYTFDGVVFSPQTVVIAADQIAAVTATNTYKKNEEPVVETGGFDLSKSLKGVSAKDFPEGTVFTVTASWSVEGKESTAEYKLPVDGSTVEGARELPVGTKVSFGEVKVPQVNGYKFKEVKFSAQTVTITSNEVVKVSATNTYEKSELPVTGASAVTGVAAAGAVLLLAGGLTLLIRRKRIS